jgi:hypothetical protein
MGQRKQKVYKKAVKSVTKNTGYAYTRTSPATATRYLITEQSWGLFALVTWWLICMASERWRQTTPWVQCLYSHGSNMRRPFCSDNLPRSLFINSGTPPIHSLTHPPIHPPTHPSIYLSIYPPNHLPTYLIIFLINIVGGGTGYTRHVGHWMAYCTCPGWLWWWRIWWNENWQGKPKYSEETCPSATLSTTNPTCQTRAAAMGSQRLTAWAMARPYLSIYLFIYLSICLSVYLSMALQPFSFLILYTVDRTPWTRDQPAIRPLPSHRIT